MKTHPTHDHEAHDLKRVADFLVQELQTFCFSPPVVCCYNPLEYAHDSHDQYIERYGRAPREVVLVGMNPGPWGMAQTGVPFGEVGMVRDWLQIQATIGKPRVEHPKRPVTGFECQRSEVSGSRLWGWAQETFREPERFFARFFVLNYCPLIFFEETGKNRTPDQLPPTEREPLLRICDEALRQSILFLKPRMVLGVGRFAANRIRVALDGMSVQTGAVPHPSPASPLANRGWSALMNQSLKELGVVV